MLASFKSCNNLRADVTAPCDALFDDTIEFNLLVKDDMSAEANVAVMNIIIKKVQVIFIIDRVYKLCIFYLF